MRGRRGRRILSSCSHDDGLWWKQERPAERATLLASGPTHAVQE